MKREVGVVVFLLFVPLVAAQPEFSTYDIIGFFSVAAFLLMFVAYRMYHVNHPPYHESEFTPPPPPFPVLNTPYDDGSDRTLTKLRIPAKVIDPDEPEETEDEPQIEMSTEPQPVMGKGEIESAITRAQETADDELSHTPVTTDFRAKDAFIYTGKDSPDYIRTHIKRARELLDQGHHEGAKHIYIQLLSIYRGLSPAEQREIYPELQTLFKDRQKGDQGS